MRPRLSLGLMAVFILCACSAGPTASGEPQASSVTPAPTAAGSAVTAGASPTPEAAQRVVGFLGPDGVATVVTNDLVVRSLPETSAQSTIDPITLSEGKLLYVLDGPVAADGYFWYQVAPFDEFLEDIADEGPHVGWVADGSGRGEVWIAPWTGECPQPVLDVIRRRAALLSLACFRNDDLTFEGTFGHCIVAGDVGESGQQGGISPGWFTNFGCELLPFDYEQGVLGGLFLHWEGGEPSQTPVDGAVVRVVGHFDDPAAQRCVREPVPGNVITLPERVVLDCRSTFVVSDLTEIDHA